MYEDSPPIQIKQQNQKSTARREENILYKVPLGVLSVYKVMSYLDVFFFNG